jgi:hypothetical protein
VLASKAFLELNTATSLKMLELLSKEYDFDGVESYIRA